jgi:hypothetical protein
MLTQESLLINENSIYAIARCLNNTSQGDFDRNVFDDVDAKKADLFLDFILKNEELSSNEYLKSTIDYLNKLTSQGNSCSHF